jgi:hypothetical protein
VIAAAVALVAVATAGAYTLGSDSGGGAETSSDTTHTSQAARSTHGTSSPTTVAPSTTTKPTTAPDAWCDSASGRCARISDIALEGDHYVATYEVKNFDPVIFQNGQGTPDDHHVHFFLDTVPPEDAGTNSAHPGVWVVWDRAKGGGELKFDQATPADAQAKGAHKLCVLVADSHHGVEQGSGNCVDLPT